MDHLLDMIPVGVKFKPTDEELVEHYLLKKINKIPLSDLANSAIPVTDLFGDQEPCELWDQRFQNHSDNLYFFTELKKRTPKSSRNVRSIGKGTWFEEVCKFIEASGDDGLLIVAVKKRFSYRNQKSSDDGRWILIEYSLVNDASDWVLCELKHNLGSNSHNNRHVLTVGRVLSKSNKSEGNDDRCYSSVSFHFKETSEGQDNGFRGCNDFPGYAIANADYKDIM